MLNCDIVHRLKCIAYGFNVILLDIACSYIRIYPVEMYSTVHRKQPHNWSGVTESSTDIITIQHEAYSLTKCGQEYEVVAEPDYDAIHTVEKEQMPTEQDYENKSTPSPVATLQKAGGKMEEA